MRKIYWVIAALFLALPLTVSAQPIWEVQSSGVTVNLRAVSFCNALVGTAVGDSGVIVHTTNGGKNWHKQISKDSLRLSGVVQLDSVTAIAVGINGIIIRTSNGGLAWKSIHIDTTNNATSIAFHDSLYGVVAESRGFILLTSDGGLNWEQDSTGYGDFLSVAYPGRSNIIATNSIDKEIRTIDGGTTWSSWDINNIVDANWRIEISSIMFTDSLNGWIVGGQWYTVYHPEYIDGRMPFLCSTFDGGNTWTYLLSPTLATNLSTGMQPNYNAIAFTYGKGFAFSGDGHIYESSGNFKTWIVDTALSSSLNAAQTVVDTVIFAVGNNGAIIKLNGIQQPSSVNGNPTQPSSFSLSQNYPNPFGSAPTTINYTVVTPGNTTLKIYNLLGEFIAEPVSGWQSAGSHSVLFNASQLPQGVYMYQLQQGSLSQTKMMLVEH
jgi:photosystem II stability/assembly factor-like uncharacterized protein